MVWGGRYEGVAGWGTHVHPWQIHADVWENQYNIAKLKKTHTQIQYEKNLARGKKKK